LQHQGDILANFKNRSVIVTAILLLASLLCACSNQVAHEGAELTPSHEPLRMAISPYQDAALILNEKQLDLEKKYGIKLEFVTVSGEDLLSSMVSAGQTVDVSYALLSEYLSKSENINHKGDDQIIFLYPLFVFKGGGLISFNPAVPEINSQTINDPAVIKNFLSFNIGVQKNTWAEMMLFVLGKKAGLKLSDLHYTDTPLSDGLLAAENGSLDIVGAGLPQRNECLKRHGRIVLTIDTVGMGDIIGLSCKESVYKKRKKDIQATTVL
jgi:ABC-type nitrate/sulfonate/bicarbonate transport system substrate-binding protein